MAKKTVMADKDDAKYLTNSTYKKKRPWWQKLLLAPFKLLWWIIKKALVILTFGILSGAFDDNNK